MDGHAFRAGFSVFKKGNSFDHVLEHRSNFYRLAVLFLIKKYHCLCVLYKIYMGDGAVLNPAV